MVTDFTMSFNYWVSMYMASWNTAVPVTLKFKKNEFDSFEPPDKDFITS